MKTATIAGIALIVLGVLAFTVGGITFTREEKKVDLGPIEINKTEKESIPLPPILGALALAGGVALVIVGARRAA